MLDHGTAIRPGLARVEKLLKRLKNPQNSFLSIHVAGTNGKGSVSAMLASVLQEAGYLTGLYTSPHLVRFNERIRVNGQEITDGELKKLLLKVKKATGVPSGKRKQSSSPTFFEFITSAAFVHFREKKIDVAVIETGLGGRLDATNVVRPLVSIITNVGIDHGEFLGHSLKSIAFEKAGIIKPFGVVITAEERPGPFAVIKKAAKEKGAQLYLINRNFKARPIAEKAGHFDYIGGSQRLAGLKLSLDGAHQLKNAACALSAIEALKEQGFKIPAFAIRRGLKKTRWPGRLEIIKRQPLVVLDCAHNPDGAKTLKQALKGIKKKYKRLILVLGIMADKDIDGILRELAPLADITLTCSPATPRAEEARRLAKRVKKFYDTEAIACEGVAEACAEALSAANANDAVCVAGSIYTVGEAKMFFKKNVNCE